MTTPSADARDRLVVARERASHRADEKDLFALTVELEGPDEKRLEGKYQLTVPATIRRRWTPTGADQSMLLVGVRLFEDALVIVPRSRAMPWLGAPTRRESFEISMQEKGNIEVPKAVREGWADRVIIRLDLGYAYLLVPKDGTRRLLRQLWGVQEI